MHPQSSVTGPLSLGELLDRAFRLYRAHFGVMTVTAVLLLAPATVVSAVINGRFLVSTFDFLDQMSGAPASSDVFADQALVSTFGSMGWVLLSWLLTLLASSVATLALTHQSIAALHGEAPSVGVGLRAAVGRLAAYLLMRVLYFGAVIVVTLTLLLAIALALLIISLLVGALTVAFADSTLADFSYAGLLLLLFCGYLFAVVFLLIPAIYAEARWIAAAPGLVDQRWGPGEALRKSWGMTRGQVWRCAGYVVLLTFLSVLVVSLPLAVVQRLVLTLMPFSFNFGLAMSGALGAIFTVLWLPLNAAATTLLYFDLRVRRESYDLELRIRLLEGEVA